MKRCYSLQLSEALPTWSKLSGPPSRIVALAFESDAVCSIGEVVTILKGSTLRLDGASRLGSGYCQLATNDPTEDGERMGLGDHGDSRPVVGEFASMPPDLTWPIGPPTPGRRSGASPVPLDGQTDQCTELERRRVA